MEGNCWLIELSPPLQISLPTFMHRSTPLTANAGVFAAGRSLLALVHLVPLERFAGKLLAAVLALVGELRDRLLYGQIAGRRTLRDLNATIRTSRRLVTKSARRDKTRGSVKSCYSLTSGEIVYLPSAKRWVKHAAHIRWPI